MTRWPEVVANAGSVASITDADVLAAVNEMRSAGPGDAMLAVMGRFWRRGPRRHDCGLVIYRVLVRLEVLLLWSLALSTGNYPADIEKMLDGASRRSITRRRLR